MHNQSGRYIKTHTLLLLAGIALFVSAVVSERLLVGGALEYPARMIYRVAFWIMFPAHVILRAVFKARDQHWPLYMWAIAAFGSPYGYWLAWRALLAYRKWRGRRLGSSAPAGAEQPPAFNRREFMIKAGAGGAGLAASAVGGFSSLIQPQLLKTRLYDLPIRDLPAGLEGLRIAHISDTHYGPFTALRYLYQAIERVNALEPDIVFLTGDYVHRTPLAIPAGVQLFTRIKARYGAVAVLGNHDHWEGAEAVRAEFRKTPIPLIDNRRLFLGPEGLSEAPSEGAICVAGVGDYWDDEVLVEEALADVPEDMPRLLLSHNPDVAETLGAKPRVDAMFSGHTHGGQVAFPGLGSPIVPSAYGQKYAGGVCQGPICPVVVSRGVGMAVLPVRFRVAPEIGLITLRRVI